MTSPVLTGCSVETVPCDAQADPDALSPLLCSLVRKKFPFDSQKVLIQIESYWDNTQVEIVFAEPAKINLENLFPPTMPGLSLTRTAPLPPRADPDSHSRSFRFVCALVFCSEIIGWQSRKVETSSMDFYYAYNTRTYNRLTLTIWLNRQPDFFLDKIVTGCAMLVVMCIMLFLLTAEEADRFMGAMAIFAGLIAYLFVASQYTPVVPYQTALDKFLSLCFFEVLFMTGVHGFLFYMREREKIAEEQKSMREAAAAAAGEEFDGVEDAHADGEGQLSIKAGNEPNQDINAGVAAKSGRVADAMPGEVEMNTIASPSAAGAAATGSGAASGASGHEAAVADGADGAAAAGVTFASSSASSSSSIATPPPAEKTAAEIAAAEDEADMNDPSLDSATRAVRRFGRIVNRFTAALGSTLTKLELTKEASAKNDGGAVAAAAAAAAVAAIAASKSDDDDDDGPPIMGADGMMRPKPKGGKRGRKRARTQHRGPMGALAFMGGLVPFKVPDLSAWASSLTFVRKLDFAFMFAFSAIFIIATAIIFGIPMKEQQEV